MTYTSDRPITVDGVRLDTLAWNIEKITRAIAGRRDADATIPGRDGVVPSLNDTLEPAQFGLDMFVAGTDADGGVPAEGRRDRLWANLDELVHLFGKRHALLDVREGPPHRTNLARNAAIRLTNAATEVKRNLLTVPRTHQPLANSANWTSTAGVAITGHPLGFTTGTEVKPAGTWVGQNTFMASVYAVDGVPSATTRRAGTWVKASRACAVYFYLDGNQAGTETGTNVPANTWTWVATGPVLASGNSILNAYLTDTGVVTEASDFLQFAGAVAANTVAGADSYFDGGTAAAEGLTYQWVGAANNSQSTATGLPAQQWLGMGGSTATQAPAVEGGVRALDVRHRAGNGVYLSTPPADPGAWFAARAKVRRIPGANTRGSFRFHLYTGDDFTNGGVTMNVADLPADGSPVTLDLAPIKVSGPGQASLFFYTFNYGQVRVSHVQLEKVTGAGQTVQGAYFDGATADTSATVYEWEGAADLSSSVAHDTRTRRAWAKVTDTIQPDVNTTGSAGRFTVGLTLPYGVWEDPYTQDWTSAAVTSGVAQEVTTLQGATDRITDAVVLVQGPVTNPRVTDPATGAYVELSGALTAADYWRVNVGTWTTRVGNLNLGSGDTAGTDRQADTRYGGTPNQAAFLPLVPTRDAGARRVKVALSGTGITTATRVHVRARRKFAL